MRLFDGLYSYEIVLLVLGAILFVALLILLLILASKRRAYAKLLPFFLVSIVMIGFPGIKSVEFSDGVARIETYTNELEQNPTDSKLRAQLSSDAASVSGRPINDPAALTTIAGAQIALGRNDQAQVNVDKALQLAPQNPKALELQRRLELDKNLADLTTKVEQQPNDSASKEQLQKTVAVAASRPIASPVTLANLARAQAAVGNRAQARVNAEKALKIDSNLAKEVRLRILAESP